MLQEEWEEKVTRAKAHLNKWRYIGWSMLHEFTQST